VESVPWHCSRCDIQECESPEEVIENDSGAGMSSYFQMTFSNGNLVSMRILVFVVQRSLQNGYGNAVCLLSSRLKVGSPCTAAALSERQLWGLKAQELFPQVLRLIAQPDSFETF